MKSHNKKWISFNGKPEPKHWLFSLYWWNPIIYIAILLHLPICVWDGGVKKFLEDTKDLILDYNWK